jgi:aldehyde dehydrogenase (NAD+)
MENIHSIFNKQQKTKFILRKTDAKTRIEKLKILKATIENFETEIYQALQTDLRKSKFEASATELFFIYGEIDFAIKNLKKWLKPKAVSRTLSNALASNKIIYEPKGVCLIIAPWNYPFQLIMSPLISAIAAGNCAILKPSEISVETAKVISLIIKKAFNEDEIACFEGGVEVSTTLLNLPFDHIFFTGSTAIGKIVMEAAAKNLTSVTLELGGKSPIIIDSTANLKKAATKIAWGKLVNAGQTCIAPDYVLIDENLEHEFINEYILASKQLFYKNEQEIDEENYGKIINEKQYSRLKNLVEKSIAFGAVANKEFYFKDEDLTISPVILSNIKDGNPIMEEEIFGPILPIIIYKNIDEAIAFINNKEKPLALYAFSNNTQNINKILNETSSGGACINDVLVHISNPNLPFGGVNHSGMGSCHGYFGFKNFSHERAVMQQSKIDFTYFVYPPYQKKLSLLKWLKKLM